MSQTKQPRPPRWVCVVCLRPVEGEVYFRGGKPMHKACLPPRKPARA